MIIANIFFNPNSTSEWLPYTKEIVTTSLASKFDKIENSLEEFNRIQTQIISTTVTESENLCVGIKKVNITQNVNTSDVIMTVLIDTVLRGFVTMNLQGDTQTIHIGLICANNNYKGIGSYIMNIVESIATHASFSEIKLESVTNAVGFYIKKGYSCDKLCKMKKTIGASFMGGGNRKSKHAKNIKMRLKCKSKKNKPNINKHSITHT